MELKYLFTTTKQIPDGEPDEFDKVILKDALYLCRRTDILQHSDMANRCSIHPLGGGFLKGIRKLKNQIFYGESLSCRVKTDEDMVKKVFNKLFEEGQWYSFEFEMYRSKYLIVAITPKGSYPSSLISGITWSKTTHADAYETFKAEHEGAYGW